MESKVATRTLYRIAAALLILLAVTLGLSFVDLGPFNFPLALLIAAAKAMLVILFFMEVRSSHPVIKVMAGAGLFWLLILIGGALADYLTRVPLPPPFRGSF